jgi:hypothetical protein
MCLRVLLLLSTQRGRHCRLVAVLLAVTGTQQAVVPKVLTASTITPLAALNLQGIGTNQHRSVRQLNTTQVYSYTNAYTVSLHCTLCCVNDTNLLVHS